MYEKEIKRFNNLVAKVDVISFDIFDTLLIRPYLAPCDLFRHIEGKYSLKGFMQERILAEKRARYIHRQQQEDINIHDIYDNICPQYTHLKNIEMELEKHILSPNPFIKYFYDKAVSSGKTIIAISDMYLPATFLAEVLNKNGLKNIKKIFVSGEYGKCKGSKHLFEEVVKELNTTPDKILHIGDNLQSDYFAAIDSGYKALFLEKYIDKFFKTSNGKRYQKLLNKNASLDYSVITALTAKNALTTKEKSYWYNLGYNLGGPFAVGYVQYIIEQCKLNNINNLLFVSRDGYVLQKIYKILAGDNALENHYIYAPRILNMKCFLDYRNKFSYLKTIFELNKDICPDFCNIPETFEEAERIFRKNIPLLQKCAENNLQEYKQYLKEQHIENSRIATVDMTTNSFSSQAFLNNLLKDKVILGLFSFAICENSEFKYKTFVNKIAAYEDNSKINLSELLISAPELPLENIKSGKPVYKLPTKNDLFKLNLYPEIEQGILDFADEYRKLFKYFPVEIDGKTAFNLLDIIVTLRTTEDMYYLKQVLHFGDANNSKSERMYLDLRYPLILRGPLMVKRKLRKLLNRPKRQLKSWVKEKLLLWRIYSYERKNLGV